MVRLVRTIARADFILLFSALILVCFGLVTMKSFDVSFYDDYFFWRQLTWLFVAALVCTGATLINWSFLKTNSIFLLLGYGVSIAMLVFLLIQKEAIRGAQSWIDFGPFHVEPVELVKPILILILAKYFARRYVAIAQLRTLFISLIYVAIPVVLVAVQPDFGSAAMLIFLWLGMAIVGEIPIRHLVILACIGLLSAAFLWQFVFFPYQKARIVAFLNPYTDARGSGYHALQSMIAVGSGQVLGKGIGYGTQSRLQFLPEHETDFIFAAFAEEWGFLGVCFLLFFFGILLWRILRIGMYAESNFEKLFAAGFALTLFAQATIHIGMNVGLLPITGLGMPLVSYGGSSLIVTFAGIGIIQSFLVHRKGIVLGSEDRFKEGILGA